MDYKVSDVNAPNEIAERPQFLKKLSATSLLFLIYLVTYNFILICGTETHYIAFKIRVIFILLFSTEWGWGDPKREKQNSSFLVQFTTINKSLKQNLLYTQKHGSN